MLLSRSPPFLSALTAPCSSLSACSADISAAVINSSRATNAILVVCFFTSVTFPILAMPFVLVLVPTVRTVLAAIPVVYSLFSLSSSFSFYCYLCIICLSCFYRSSCSTPSTAAHRTRCLSAHSLRIHHLFVIRVLLCTLRLCPFRSDEITATPRDVYMCRFQITRY